MHSDAVRFVVRCGMSRTAAPVPLSCPPAMENGMPITMAQASGLLALVARTEPVEYSCDDVAGAMAQLVDGTAAEPDVRVRHHLAICGNCAEEARALATAIGDGDGR